MSDYICPYNCSYRTNSGFCGYTGGYDACQYRQLNHEENTVVGYVPPLKRTNADRIRAMSDEELEWFINSIVTVDYDPFTRIGGKIILSVKDWLKEASDD